MSITSITIENFKGIKDKVKIDFKPITLLFGPNSAGKSTIIQALHYLKQIFVNGNPDADVSFAYDGIIRLGGFKNLIHNHDLNNKIKFSIQINRNVHSKYYKKIFSKLGVGLLENEKNILVEISILWDKAKSIPVIDEFKLYIDKGKVIHNIYHKETKKNYLLYFNCHHRIFDKVLKYRDYDINATFNLDKNKYYTYKEVFSEIFKKYFNNVENKYNYKFINRYKIKMNDYVSVFRNTSLEIFTFEDLDGLKDEDYEYKLFNSHILEQLIHGSFNVLKNELIDFLRVGPLREIPQRVEANQVPSQQRFITGKAAWDILYSADDSFIGKFNYWISSEDKFNTGYSAYQKNIVELDKKKLPEDITIEYISSLPSTKKLIFKDSHDVEVMPQDVGFGFSQIIPVVVAALMGENETKHIYFGSKEHKKIISIEQPELHIHPRLQVELGDLFIEQSVNKNVIFLIETHSEHLLLRILRRIRETSEGELEEGATPITPEQVSIIYVQQNKNGSTVQYISISEDGELEYSWPEGFFAERAKELF